MFDFFLYEIYSSKPIIYKMTMYSFISWIRYLTTRITRNGTMNAFDTSKRRLQTPETSTAQSNLLCYDACHAVRRRLFNLDQYRYVKRSLIKQ